MTGKKKTQDTTPTTLAPVANSGSDNFSISSTAALTQNDPYELYHVAAGEWNLPIVMFGPGQKPSGVFAGAAKATTIGQLLTWFAHQPSEVIQAVQEGMLRAGVLSPSSAYEPGQLDTATIEAFSHMVESGAAAGQGEGQAYAFNTFYNLAASGTIDAALGGLGSGAAQSGVALEHALAVKPAAEDYKVTSTADLENIFAHAYFEVNGIAPTSQQTAAFVREAQQSEINATSSEDAPRLKAEQEYLNRSNRAANVLDNMGNLDTDGFTEAFMNTMGTTTQAGAARGGMRAQQLGAAANNQVIPSQHVQVSPVVWQQTVKELQKGGLLGSNAPMSQAQAPPGMVKMIIEAAAQSAFNNTQSWDSTARYLITGHVNGGSQAMQGFVNTVLQEIQVNANKLLSQATGGLVNAQGIVQAPYTDSVTQIYDPSAAAVQAAETADPQQANSASMQNVYNEIVDRMIRPGGFYSPTDVDANTGAGQGGATSGNLGPAVSLADVPSPSATPVGGTS